ncbi:MAG: phosphotransferase [Pseudomonadota bacterium]
MPTSSNEDPVQAALDLSIWTAPDHGAPLEGGITNHNVLVRDGGEAFVVRLGHDMPEHMVMRWNELAISRAAHATGIAPEVVHAEPGVLVLRYIDSVPLSAEDLHDPETLSATVDLVQRLHAGGLAALSGPVLSFWVFHILRSYAGFLRENGSDHVPKLDTMLEQAADLEARVGPVTLVLGHNDLLPANILRGTDRMWLIDWEYGGLNSPLFDLGGLATNAGLPRDAEEAMLTQYFGEAPVPDLWRRYGAMKCASLLREAMWSMVSELTSTLDFDYRAYTEENLDTYRKALGSYLAE